MFWANVALAVLCLAASIAMLLTGCSEGAPEADHTAPDLGECVRLAATLTDSGPVAHVYVTEGQPCEGGTCNGQGECVP